MPTPFFTGHQGFDPGARSRACASVNGMDF